MIEIGVNFFWSARAYLNVFVLDLNLIFEKKNDFSIFQQNEKIENLQRTVNAQAALISSQTEMLKEINKKLLENEQKFADFLHTKGMASSPTKRPLPSVMSSPTDDGEQIENASSAPPTKKFKAQWAEISKKAYIAMQANLEFKI